MLRRATVFLTTLTVVILAMLAFSDNATRAADDKRVKTAALANGMQIVVVEDHRAPVVTHMVWYKVGAADEPTGKSGIAHFLEHLMFKSTEKIASGEFSKIVSRMGGRDNAFTSQDVTAYYQEIASNRLPIVMKMEADRMVNLRLTEKEVLTERDVILEERRSRVENNPSAILDEQMSAALYLAHPYGTPVIGWQHEIAQLNRKDALDFYKQYYAPNNAILVVGGDVTLDEVKKLAEETFGKLPANPAIKQRSRPEEPPQRAARRVELKDPRAGRPMIYREYLTPSYLTAAPGEAEALQLLMRVAGGGSTSRLYRKLVVEQKIAADAGGYYGTYSRDSSTASLYAIPTEGHTLAEVEAAIDTVIADLRRNGITQTELDRARKRYLAEYIYETDSQSKLAYRYAWALTVGQKIEDIEARPDRIRKVTLDDVKSAAAKWLDVRRSVTGHMVPEQPEVISHKPPGKETAAPAAKSRS
ncbi:MAG: putative protease [Pseudomonadota bacterium]|jgi:zinc protease